MRILGVSIVAASAAWALAANPASALTSFEDAPSYADSSTISMKSVGRPAPAPSVREDEPRGGEASPADAPQRRPEAGLENRDTRTASNTCRESARAACERRRRGAGGSGAIEPIPDSALMRRRTIL